MVVASRLCRTLILGVALFYGVGDCILFATYNDSLYCSDVVCFPLRILNVELLNLSCTNCTWCTNSTISTIITPQIRNKSETFFNQQCSRNLGLAYNKSNFANACPTPWKVRGIRVTYNCSYATTATLSVERTTKFSSNEGLGFTTSNTANGSRDGKPSSPPNTTMIGEGAVAAAAVCTSVGAFAIVFIAVYLWRRKPWKKCLPYWRRQDKEALSPKSSTIGKPSREFCEHIYENGNTSRPKGPAAVIKAAASQGEASSEAEKCDDHSAEEICADAPCYLELFPADSHHELKSQDYGSVRFSAPPNVLDEKDKEKHENYYTLPPEDSAYFVLEQSCVDPSTTNSLGQFY